MTMTPNDAPMLNRLSIAAFSGTTNRPEHEGQEQHGQHDHGADEQRKPAVDLVADVGEGRGLTTDVGARLPLAQHGRDHIGAEPLDRFEGGTVLGPGGREGHERRDSGVRVDFRGCDGCDSLVEPDGSGQGLEHARISGDVDRDDQWPVDPGSEAVGDEVVGQSLGAVRRERTLVRGADLKRQDGCGQRQQRDVAPMA